MKVQNVRLIEVHLAPHEWGPRLMDAVAMEQLATHKEQHKPEEGEWVVVRVHEHGGWALGYTILDKEFKIVYSANDRSYWPPAQEAFREAAYKANWSNLKPVIRRS